MNHGENRDAAIFDGGSFYFSASELSEVRPLRFEEVSRGPRGREWDEWVKRYHYLGYRKLVGKHLKYLIYSRRGELLAATGWSSSVWKLKSRGRIYWDAWRTTAGS